MRSAKRAGVGKGREERRSRKGDEGKRQGKELEHTLSPRVTIRTSVHGAILILGAAADKDGIVCVRLDMLLQVLGTLE